MAASRTTPAPVAPPPITSTSQRSGRPRTAGTLDADTVTDARRPRGRPCAPSVLLHPVEGLGDRLLPVAVGAVAVAGFHLRLPALVLVPVRAQILDLVPEPDRETG